MATIVFYNMDSICITNWSYLPQGVVTQQMCICVT